MSVVKNFFKSFLFLLKHAILLVVSHLLFKIVAINIILPFLLEKLRFSFVFYYFNDRFFSYLIVFILYISCKFLLYSNARENDIKDVISDPIMYGSEFFTRIVNVVFTCCIFLTITVVLTCLGGLPGIVFFNLCLYSFVLTSCKEYEVGRKNQSTSNYQGIKAITDSYSLTHGFRTKLILANSIVFSLSAYLVIFIIPNELFVKDINISMLLKFTTLDFSIAFSCINGLDLWGIFEDAAEAQKTKEILSAQQERRRVASV